MPTIVGAIAGGEEERERVEKTITLSEETELEKVAGKTQLEEFKTIKEFVSEGPGLEDVQRALESTRGLATTLGELSKTGFVPTAQDIRGASELSQKLFEPERVRQAQQFERQRTESQRLSARLGRPVNDPILQARLLRAQSEQAAFTGAQERAFGTQIAFTRPQERLGLQQAQTGLLAGLGSQALANRTALLGLGSQLAASERQFRLATAKQTAESFRGGGFKGQVEGGFAAAGAAASIFGSIFGAASGTGGGGGGNAGKGVGLQGGGVASGGGGGGGFGGSASAQQIGQFQLPQFAQFGQSAPGFQGQQSPFRFGG